MTKRVVSGTSTVAVVAALGVVVGAACGGSSGAKKSDSSSTAGNGDGGEKTSTGGASSGGTTSTGGAGSDTGGGVAETGVAETGGAETGGTGGSSADGGSTAVAHTGTVGTECTEPGALSCAGTAQRVVTVCGADGVWDVVETCAADEVCDSQPGKTRGSCQVPTPTCDVQGASYRFCSDTAVMECGPDGIAHEVESCEDDCWHGACTKAEEPDPCPTGEDWVNCAEDCGGRSQECQRAADSGVGVYVGAPVLVRTLPPASGEVSPCREAGVPIERWLLPVAVGEGVFRVTVESPWWSGDINSVCDGAVTGSCYIVVSSTPFIWIVTDDPNAASRNALVEEVPEGTECP
jgi:hypothetical protein